MADRRRGFGARGWLIVVVILVCGAEVAARLIEEKKARSTDPYEVRYETAGGVPIFHEEGLLALRRDPQTGYALAPDQVLDGKLPDGRRATVKVNAQGFRGDDWRLEKPAGRARVIVAGGSAAFGVGASSDQTTVSGYLEKLLAAGAPEGRSVEVLNAGIPGADATQAFAVLAARLLDHAPDLMIVLDGWNDFCRGILAPTGSAIVDPFFLEIDDLCAREREGARALLRSSALFRRLEPPKERWREERTPALDGTGDPKSFFGEREEWPDRPDAAVRYYRATRRTAALCKGAGVRLILAPQPEIFQRAEPLPPKEKALRDALPEGYGRLARMTYPRWVSAASAAARDYGASLVDCRSAFDGKGDGIFLGPARLSDRGNELVAERLAPEVRRLLWEEGRR